MSEIPMPSDSYDETDERPFGITILGFLQILAGLFMIAVGLLILIIPIFGWIVGPVLLILGFLSFYVGKGLWGLEEWAWMWSFIINILSILFGIVGQNWGGVIISLIIVIYLNTEDVKSKFVN
ncbi:MAG: hypothetical protein GF411_01290 [Candidatus Lokiarchaeota archaeon]|nr:hypothetical protein [Candidatus Lokiarchaeota archaeon]